MYFIKQIVDNDTLKREYRLVECSVYSENDEYYFIQLEDIKICFPKNKTNTANGYLFSSYNDALKRFTDLQGRRYFD